MTTQPTITTRYDRLYVESPYHPDFPLRAKNLGGLWNSVSKIWDFDSRDEPRVRALCLEIFGSDGKSAAPVVDIRATWHSSGCADLGAIFIAGRQVARATSRDSATVLGDGVIVLEGELHSGGSRKNWATVAEAGTVIEIRDVPEALARAAVSESDKYLEVEIITQADIDREALQAERAGLVARIAEIDSALAANGGAS